MQARKSLLSLLFTSGHRRGYDGASVGERETMTTEPKRNFFRTAVHNFFAMYLGVTPPAPGKEGFYAALLLAVTLFLIAAGYLIVRFLLSQMLG
jgi:hypothetical protein